MTKDLKGSEYQKEQQEIVDKVREMREMDDHTLLRFYETIVVSTYDAQRMAEFKRYDRDMQILRFTTEEVARRMNERNRQPVNFRRGFGPGI